MAGGRRFNPLSQTNLFSNLIHEAYLRPFPHIAVVEKLIEALGFRQIDVVQEKYAVSADGMRMFGVMDLSSGFQGCRFAIGSRNSHDKSFRVSCPVGQCSSAGSSRRGCSQADSELAPHEA